MRKHGLRKLLLVFTAMASLCLLRGTAAAQEFESYSVKGYPELTRNYSRFSNMSVIFTEGYPVQIRRKKSGIVSATLKVVTSFQGADSNPKTVGIGIVGAKMIGAGDIDTLASGTHSWVIIDNRIRTQYQNNILAGGMRSVKDERSLTGTNLVSDYYFILTPSQLAQFADANLVEIATSEGTVLINADACRKARPLLKWYLENTPSRPRPSPRNSRRTNKRRTSK
ncbi:MAG TPA: hypothetical protein VF723_11225 [Pyrinomonadaceae bacterium]